MDAKICDVCGAVYYPSNSCLGYLDNWFSVRRAAPVDKEK